MTNNTYTPIIGTMQEDAMSGNVKSPSICSEKTIDGDSFLDEKILPRIPVTQEFMVESILAERRGDGPAHPASKFFPDVLFESIQDMVGMLASRYIAISGTDKEDLCQMCMKRIWERLEIFDSSRAKFSTWTWRVCMGVIFKECRKTQRRRTVIVGSEKSVEINATESPHEAHLMRSEIRKAVLELIDKYPEKENIIVELFGNPRDHDYVPYSDICFAKSARAAGVSPRDVSLFYKKKAQPFLQRKLQGGMCERTT